MKGELEAAQILIDYGSDCDAPDLQGNSPLHYASSWGRVNVLKLLVDFDCATDSRNSEGFTAAEYAYSFGVLRELEDCIRQHLQDVKTAQRSSRRKHRSRKDTLRSKRRGSTSALSITLPSIATQAEGRDSGQPSASSSASGSPMPGHGLGLLQMQMSPVPQLGMPIPPTPVDGSPVHSPPPTRRPTASSDEPDTPRTPASPYGNTTSPQPSPLASPVSGSRPSTPSNLSPLASDRFGHVDRLDSDERGSVVAVKHGGPVPCFWPVWHDLLRPDCNPDACVAHACLVRTPSNNEAIQRAQQRGRARVVSGASAAPSSSGGYNTSSSSLGVYPVPAALHPGGPASASAPLLSPRPTAPPSPPPPPHHNKLIRKSRSHAQTPTLSLDAASLGLAGSPSVPQQPMLSPPPPAPAVPFQGGTLGLTGAGAGRSVSGPPTASLPVLPLPGEAESGSARSSFDASVLDELRRASAERERELQQHKGKGGHKLRKERKDTGGSAGEGALGKVGTREREEREKEKAHHHGGRLARALGFRK
ncbi:hypothetical protein Rhopal_003302-T1 [Rhodotorula paludigena]|uniref:Uncharacterized protein n=1 Tax=Rhodotorula paludigena TaxID=86838 RepID=A0AAV5GIQ5_9BASI|nr:hypothetical protein Rhopal_003302-T1 [Rhodotorula paludigena]